MIQTSNVSSSDEVLTGSLIDLIGQFYNIAAECYRVRQDFSNAVNFSQKALELASTLGNTERQ